MTPGAGMTIAVTVDLPLAEIIEQLTPEQQRALYHGLARLLDAKPEPADARKREEASAVSRAVTAADARPAAAADDETGRRSEPPRPPAPRPSATRSA